MRQIAAVLLLASVCFAASHNKPQVLFDFRTNKPQDKRVVHAIAQPEAKTVYTALFTKYLSSIGECSEAAIASGKGYVPNVMAAAQGSFTRPGAHERVYLVDEGSCVQQQQPVQRIALFEDGKLVTSANIAAQEIARVLDDNGLTVLLLSSTVEADSRLITHAQLVSFAGGSPHALRDFGTVGDDACGVAGDERTASVLTLMPVQGSQSDLTTETYHQDCFGGKWIKQ